MHAGIVISTLVLFGGLTSSEKVYNRLEKKYMQDSEKCLNLAQKMVSKDHTRPEPYYFMAKVYYDEYASSAKRSHKVKYFNRSLSGLYKAQKYGYAKMHRASLVDSLKSHIMKELPKLRSELKEHNETDRLLAVERKAARIHGYVPATKEPSDDKVESPDVTARVNETYGLYFGLPTGNEEVPSANHASELELLDILNKARAEKGMGKLVWDEDLARAARYHACDMATQEYFDHSSHDRVKGELVEVGGAFERIRKFYTSGFVNSENLAAGNHDPKRTYMQWYNSPGHYMNMFNASSKKVGIGLYQKSGSPYTYYWGFCTALN